MSEQGQGRFCKACGLNKPRSDFYCNEKTRYCRECTRARASANHFRNKHLSADQLAKKIALKKLPVEIQEGIVKAYQAGEEIKTIATRLKIHRCRIEKVLHRHKITIRPRRFYSASEDEELARRYYAGENIYDLARSCNVSTQPITSALRRAGVEMRSQHDCQRIYDLNESVFDNAEHDSEAAYWVGFLMADGCIKNPKLNTFTVNLCLAEKDGEHVYRFRTFLQSAHPIRVYYPRWRPGRAKSTPSVYLTVTSYRLAMALMSYGVVQRKSLVAKVDRLEMSPSFWRGVIDGDGSVTLRSRHRTRQGQPKPPVPMVRLVGSKMLLEQFLAFVRTLASTATTVRPKTGTKIFRTQIGGRIAAVATVQALYGSEGTSLPRKAAIAYQILRLFS